MHSFSLKCGVFAAVTYFAAGSVFAETVDLDAVRAATEKYMDVNVALADGYIRDPADQCVSAGAEGLPAEWGGMGIHYIHPAMLGITGDKPRVNGNGIHTDWMQPAILMYEPQQDGSLELVGVENLVWQAAWAETGKPQPEINGKPWDAMADDPATEADEAHYFAPHFDQHVWIFRDNPAGTLMPFNPAVTCEYHTSS
ncbi:hypothetical protein [Aliiroseovarius sp.]|uniref:hypothetical protein n=1 Tax=Aliiroseovarius sp. TaxID=1872442 RepID=UPI0026195D2D|nr:hypothetical protein [Aliiroseovarius sp.]